MKKLGLVLMVLLLITTSVFAGDKALELDSSNVEDGAVDVVVTQEFKLVFTNNVINMKVKDENIKLISLKNSKGEAVEINVEMADNQVSPDLKRDVVVKAVSELNEGEVYSLVVQKGFSAKNGSLLADEVVINFTTVGGSGSSSTFLIGGVLAVVILGFFFMRKRNVKA